MAIQRQGAGGATLRDLWYVSASTATPKAAQGPKAIRYWRDYVRASSR